MVTITRTVTKYCPYEDEVDVGRLTIDFEDDAPELHELARTIDALATERLTHEEYTRRVQSMVDGTTVITRWRTGAWDVEVWGDA